LLLSILVFTNQIGFSQDLSGKDLRSINIDDLSDATIYGYLEKAKQANISDAQLLETLQQRGLPQSEILKLQNRMQGSSKTVNASSNNNGPNSTNRKYNSPPQNTNSEPLNTFEKQIFGMDLFTNPALSFEPNIQVATPQNYILGVGDEIVINVFGQSEANYKLLINSEGNINIPSLGPISVNGLSIASATNIIKEKLSNSIYRAIKTGHTKIQISLGTIRTIKVIVIGQARKPGVYAVSSLSTLFNVLYLCGGPNVDGSFRSIKLVRNGKLITALDLYSFLFNGDISKNLLLQDNDVINISYIQNRIKLTGAFRKPMYFEVFDRETFEDVLKYAGGFADSAYVGSVTMHHINGKEKVIKVIEPKNYGQLFLTKGDEVFAQYILNRFSNRVTIGGAVARPGNYDISNNLTVAGLIRRADGLKEDAFKTRGFLTRINEDLTKSNISFDVTKILNGLQEDIQLQKNDEVIIVSINTLLESSYVTIEGEVRNPMNYTYRKGMTIKDIIVEAGGFTNAATGKHIEIGRRITDALEGKESIEIAKVINIDGDLNYNILDSAIALSPFDIIIVRANPGYFVQKTITIEGEVTLPGKYVLETRNERVSDIIKKAGGVSLLADTRAASLRRINKIGVDSIQKKLLIDKLAGGDSTNKTNLKEQLSQQYDLVAIQLDRILENPRTSEDVLLQEGDILFLPRKDAIVKVRGEVLVPSQLSYIPNENMKIYINRSGGYTSNAVKRKAFVLQANGNAMRIKKFLFFKKYPLIQAGDEIIVPKQSERNNKKLTTGEIIGLTSAIASLATIVVAFLRL